MASCTRQRRYGPTLRNTGELPRAIPSASERESSETLDSRGSVELATVTGGRSRLTADRDCTACVCVVLCGASVKARDTEVSRALETRNAADRGHARGWQGVTKR